MLQWEEYIFSGIAGSVLCPDIKSGCQICEH